jgi:hypothetical protein
MIDLEYPDLAGEVRAIGKRVEPGAENDVLRHAVVDEIGEAVLGVTAPADDLCSCPSQDDVRAVRTVIPDQLVGLVSQQG